MEHNYYIVELNSGYGYDYFNLYNINEPRLNRTRREDAGILECTKSFYG